MSNYDQESKSRIQPRLSLLSTCMFFVLRSGWCLSSLEVLVSGVLSLAFGSEYRVAIAMESLRLNLLVPRYIYASIKSALSDTNLLKG
jgi:hypothetical protein